MALQIVTQQQQQDDDTVKQQQRPPPPPLTLTLKTPDAERTLQVLLDMKAELTALRSVLTGVGPAVDRICTALNSRQARESRRGPRVADDAEPRDKPAKMGVVSCCYKTIFWLILAGVVVILGVIMAAMFGPNN